MVEDTCLEHKAGTTPASRDITDEAIALADAETSKCKETFTVPVTLIDGCARFLTKSETFHIPAIST